jgi:hypothetical protein
MPTSRRDAKFLARMFSMMAVGFALLIVGLLLDTPPGREAQPPQETPCPES